jgi:hypothetical protein
MNTLFPRDVLAATIVDIYSHTALIHGLCEMQIQRGVLLASAGAVQYHNRRKGLITNWLIQHPC